MTILPGGKALSASVRFVRRSVISLPFVAWMALGGSPVLAQPQPMTYGGGPIMQTANAYLIFWQPLGTQYDHTIANGVGNYVTLIETFINSLSWSTYYSTVGEYSGTCNNFPCLPQNSPGAVTVASVVFDTSAYPKPGTQAQPLYDSDIQKEIQTQIQANGWPEGLGSIYIVFTTENINECFTPGAVCTFPIGFTSPTCAYHGSFLDQKSNEPVVYIFLPQPITIGCNQITAGQASPNGQASSDSAVYNLAHEMVETITDPEGSAGNVAWMLANGTEIADDCLYVGAVPTANGSDVTLSGTNFWVPNIYSNSAGCVHGVPSLVLAVATGANGLRSDLMASVTVVANPTVDGTQTFTLKAPHQGPFSPFSYNQQMFGTNGVPMGSLQLSFGCYFQLPFFICPGGVWDIQNVWGGTVKADGTPTNCSFSAFGITAPVTELTLLRFPPVIIRFPPPKENQSFTLATPGC